MKKKNNNNLLNQNAINRTTAKHLTQHSNTIKHNQNDTSRPETKLHIASSQIQFVSTKSLRYVIHHKTPQIILPRFDSLQIDLSNDNSSSALIFRLIERVCKCGDPGEDAIELGILKVLLFAVQSPCVLIGSDYPLN